MAWNDPQWGNRDNRKNSGPPDLDEVWRKFNQKLNGMFGGKSGAQMPTPPADGVGNWTTSDLSLAVSAADPELRATDAARVLPGDLVEHGCNHLAGSAPVGPVVHEHGFEGFQNLVFE